MRIIKLGIISILFFGLLITGFSLFFPSHVRISRAINIGAPADVARNNIKEIDKWSNWYPGFDTLSLSKGANENERNFAARGMENGSIIMKSVSVNEMYATISTDGKKSAINGWRVLSEFYPDSVTVQWYMDFKLRWYPWEKFSSLLLEKRYGPVMEKGLQTLKNMLEKQVER